MLVSLTRVFGEIELRVMLSRIRLQILMLEAAVESADVAPAWVAYASAGIALSSMIVALIFGLVNRATSRAALDLSRRQEARRESRIDLYVVHAAAWERPDSDDRVLGANLQIANPTDRETSVTHLELHVTYTAHGRLATIKVPAVDSDIDFVPHAQRDQLTVPLRLLANEARSGWCLFSIPAALTGRNPVDRYDLVVRDLHGIEQGLQIAVFPKA